MWLTTDELNIIPGIGMWHFETALALGTTTFPCRRVQLSKYQSMVAIVSLCNPSTTKIWINSYSTGTPGGAGAGTTYPLVTAANYRYSTATVSTNLTGSGSEVLSARTAMGTTAISVTAATTSSLNYYIEVKSDDLLDGYPYVAVTISTVAAVTTAGICVNYVMKPRYPQLDQIAVYNS